LLPAVGERTGHGLKSAKAAHHIRSMFEKKRKWFSISGFKIENGKANNPGEVCRCFSLTAGMPVRCVPAQADADHPTQ
jgi:hypothetical protein